MYSTRIAVFCTFLGSIDGLSELSFPPGFKFGVATAAYQVEGAWNVSDKGESVWDWFVHTHPEAIADGSTGDVACDSYHQWETDVQNLEELGVHFYRFSISWPRLLPTGYANKISEDGARYYNNLIDRLLEKGIEPLVTMYHWDLPLSLQDLGGWTNPLISDWFAEYARVCYTLFGDRVKLWLTINEPVVICDYVYNTGEFPPGYVEPDVSPYLCNRHLLLAHAKAYRIYEKEFKAKYNGQISIANNVIWVEPASPEYEELAQLANENMVGRYSHPIFSKDGGWPPALQQAFDQKSQKDGLPQSKLPEFTSEEVDFIKGTFDFYGINHYTSRLVRPAVLGEDLKPFPLGDLPDLDAKFEKNALWHTSHSPVLYIYPEGMRHSLAWLKKQYGDIPFLITESGYTNKGGLHDPDRIQFFNDYLEQVLLSIKEDGVNVTGFTAWSLMDDFEWATGYNAPFGLYEVDFTSPMRTRTLRSSAVYYKQVIQRHSLNVTL